jgi:hypothetical protein
MARRRFTPAGSATGHMAPPKSQREKSAYGADSPPMSADLKDAPGKLALAAETAEKCDPDMSAPENVAPLMNTAWERSDSAAAKAGSARPVISCPSPRTSIS